MTAKEYNKARKTNKLDDLKIPPHSIEAEQSVLGGLLLDNSAWDSVSELLTERDFYRPEHKTIFEIAASLLTQGKAVDVLTLAEALKANNELDIIGGDIYLFELSKNTPSVANIVSYAEIVRERSVLRQMIAAGAEIANMGYQPQGRVFTELLDQAEQKVFQIAEQTNRGQGPQSMRSLAAEVLKELDEADFSNGDSLKNSNRGFTPRTPVSKIILSKFRNIILQLTQAGLLAARARGRKGGRPKVLDQTKQILAVKLYEEKKHTIAQICKMMGLSKPTLYKYIAANEPTNIPA